jgi:hypothetical protein
LILWRAGANASSADPDVAFRVNACATERKGAGSRPPLLLPASSLAAPGRYRPGIDSPAAEGRIQRGE